MYKLVLKCMQSQRQILRPGCSQHLLSYDDIAILLMTVLCIHDYNTTLTTEVPAFIHPFVSPTLKRNIHILCVYHLYV